jgi:YD repeat-containing protein
VLRTILGILVFLTVQCALTTGAKAQTGSICIEWWGCGAYSLYNTTCYPTPPSDAFNCATEGPWSMVCEVVTNNCTSPPSWCPTCGKGNATPSGGGPINLTNGNTYIQEMDVRIPGLGGGLQVQRTWNSIWPTSESGFQSGMFGLGWRSTYEERVFQGTGDASGYMAYLRSDGGLWFFSSAGALVAPANQKATLTHNGTQTWTITFLNGENRVFSYTSGSLTAVVDRNGNTTSLSYDGVGRLTTVTDPASRHLYFSYGSGSSLLVTGITSDVGISTAYSYDSQGRLTQVTEPDQSTLNFQYNNQSLISAVVDSNGKTLEAHTYDGMGRGLTSARANGVDAITVSYPQ